MITITYNTKKQVIKDPLTLTEFLENEGIAPEGIAVAHNRSVVPRDQWPHLHLKEGDQIDVLHAIEGG